MILTLITLKTKDKRPVELDNQQFLRTIYVELNVLIKNLSNKE